MSSALNIDRQALSEVFKDPRTLLAFEQLLQQASTSPSDVSTLVQAMNDTDALLQGVDLYAPYMNGSFLCYRMR